MNKRVKQLIVTTPFAMGIIFAGQGAAFASPPDGPGTGEYGEFLCPAVGDGVKNADSHNGDNGIALINDGDPIASGDFSFLPGNNQAGANANSKALNTQNPDASPGPGEGNSDWSPIWPAANPNPG
jgi:hypothetical protein